MTIIKYFVFEFEYKKVCDSIKDCLIGDDEFEVWYRKIRHINAV